MDCLVAVPGGDRTVLPPSAAAMQALPASMPPACVVGSPLLRGSMYLPRLCSIPETAEPSTACRVGDDVFAAAAQAAAAVTATDYLQSSSPPQQSVLQSQATAAQAAVESSSRHTEQPESASCSGAHTDAFACSSSDEPCSSSTADDAAAAASCETTAQEPLSSAVVASTWAISIRHFTDCVPITADSICSSIRCHTLSALGSSDVATTNPSAFPTLLPTSSSSKQQQVDKPGIWQAGTQQQHNGNAGDLSSSQPRSSSSSSSLLLPAAEDDSCRSCEGSLSLSLGELDASEWQPWDRVAKWLEAHPESTARTANAATAASCGSSAAAAAGAQAHTAGSSGSSRSSRGQREASHSGGQPCSSQQQQQQQQGEADEEPLFDAPEWWQESVKARLEEQREAFHSSWWCRLKISMGLAAQRASA